MPAGQVEAMAGMSMCRSFVVPAGQVIYRFYDTGRASTPGLGAESGWWLEFNHFQSVKHFALRHGYALSYAARLFTAILYEFSEVNAFVACEAKVDLLCWKGRGKQMSPREKDARDFPTMTPMQSVLEVYQLYIPGLGKPESKASSWLAVQRHGVLAVA